MINWFKRIKATLIVTFFFFPINYEITCYSPPPSTAEMSLVYERPVVLLSTPIAQRGVEFRSYLAATVKVITKERDSGSGTIIYYDKKTREAYIASCGHLWSGSKSREELKENPKTVRIIVWYHNHKKLRRPRAYTAQVLFWSNIRGDDFSLLKFKPVFWIFKILNF